MNEKGKTIFRGGLVSEGAVSGKKLIQTISGSNTIKLDKTYLSETIFKIDILTSNQIIFDFSDAASMIGNSYQFYISSSSLASLAYLNFKAKGVVKMNGLALFADGNIRMSNATSITINESKFLKGTLVNVIILSGQDVSININSPENSSIIDVT